MDMRPAVLLRSLPIQAAPSDGEGAREGCGSIARRPDVSVHDAAHVRLAFTGRLRLATADVRIRRACADAWVEVLPRPDAGLRRRDA